MLSVIELLKSEHLLGGVLTIAEKSAEPTPTITIDSGKKDNFTIRSIVFCISVMIPSYSNTLYNIKPQLTIAIHITQYV